MTEPPPEERATHELSLEELPPPAAPLVEPEPWRRLDPRMLLVHPVLEMVKFLPFIIGAFVVGSGGDGVNWWQFAGVGVPIALGVMRFITTSYRITSSQVELRRGLVGQKVLTARLDRVRAVELTSSPIHRVLGLGKVEIGTASAATEGSDKFVLDGLPMEQAREMRAALLHRAAPATGGTPGTGRPTEVTAPQPDVVLLTFDKRWVRYAPLTSSGNVIAAGLLAVLGQFGESVGDRLSIEMGMFDWFTEQSLATVIPIAIAVFVVLFLILGAVFAVLGYLVTNWGFTLSRDAQGRSFHVSRGLLTTSETSLERERVRGLEVIEPLGLRVAGAGRLAAIVTGVGGSGSSKAQLVPPAPRGVIDTVGSEVIEVSEPLHLTLTQHGPAARRRRYVRALVGALFFPAVALVLVLTTPVDWWVILPTLLLLPVAVFLAGDRYARLGHALTDDYLIVRSGSLRGRRDILQRSGIIGWNIQQSWFQRRVGLATLVATTAAGQQAYAAIDIPECLAIALADEAVPGLIAPFLA